MLEALTTSLPAATDTSWAHGRVGLFIYEETKYITKIEGKSYFIMHMCSVHGLPGAQMSTQEPTLLYEAAMSFLSVAATVMAGPAPEGEPVHASAPKSLPAATATGMSEATIWDTASSREGLELPPKDMLTTAGHLQGGSRRKIN